MDEKCFNGKTVSLLNKKLQILKMFRCESTDLQILPFCFLRHDLRRGTQQVLVLFLTTRRGTQQVLVREQVLVLLFRCCATAW